VRPASIEPYRMRKFFPKTRRARTECRSRRCRKEGRRREASITSSWEVFREDERWRRCNLVMCRAASPSLSLWRAARGGFRVRRAVVDKGSVPRGVKREQDDGSGGSGSSSSSSTSTSKGVGAVRGRAQLETNLSSRFERMNGGLRSMEVQRKVERARPSPSDSKDVPGGW
jgi:hypothetical protein